MRIRNAVRPAFAVAWGVTLALTFAIAVVGNGLVDWVRSFSTLRTAGIVILSAVSILVAVWVVLNARHVSWFRLGLSVVVAAALVWWGSTFERPAETLHILLFGALGAIGVLAFGLKAALVLAPLCAGADELLQLYLPDRVGDLKDVTVNTIAAWGGCVVGWANRRDAE